MNGSIGTAAPLMRATSTVLPGAAKPPTSSPSIRQPTNVEAGSAISTGTARPDPSSVSTR
jgi:hypothetical protein